MFSQVGKRLVSRAGAASPDVYVLANTSRGNLLTARPGRKRPEFENWRNERQNAHLSTGDPIL